ncbi:MAG: Rdx family protein [Alphaproteobacteria bacterium]
MEAGRIGSFEITRDGEAVFSKLDTGRIPGDDEVREMSTG